MKTSSVKLFETITVLISVLLYFFTREEVFPNYIFLVYGIIIAFYYFPIKLYLLVRNQDKESSGKSKMIISAFTLSLIISFSIIMLFLTEGGIFKIMLEVLAIINSGLIIYFILYKQTHFLFWMHLGYGFLAFFAVFL